MKQLISRILCAAIGVVLASGAVTAQDGALGAAAGDRYVISAKAGGVNFVSGSVTVLRTEGKSGQMLKGDKLEIGDKVETGSDGKVEVLLNPGSYLRVGPLSAVEFITTDLDNLQIKLGSGSGIFEVFATEDFAVTVNTPKTNFTLVESGVYRVDVETDGTGKVAVWKGKARIGTGETATVKSGREGYMNGAEAAIVKFDRDDKDDLEVWSKSRAKDLAKVTGRLQRNTMRTALMRSFLGRQWNMYSSFGLWVWDPFSRSSCFLPFGWGWGSPYGYGFGHSIWNYNLPAPVFYPPANNGTPGAPPQQVKTNRAIREGGYEPPFTRVQGSSGATGRDVSLVRSQPASPQVTYSEPVRSSVGSSSSSESSAPVQQSKPGRP